MRNGFLFILFFGGFVCAGAVAVIAKSVSTNRANVFIVSPCTKKLTRPPRRARRNLTAQTQPLLTLLPLPARELTFPGPNPPGQPYVCGPRTYRSMAPRTA